MMSKQTQKINITEKELDRDITNLSLPEVDITPGELNCYDEATELWLQNGRKGEPSDYIKEGK